MKRAGIDLSQIILVVLVFCRVSKRMNCKQLAISFIFLSLSDMSRMHIVTWHFWFWDKFAQVKLCSSWFFFEMCFHFQNVKGFVSFFSSFSMGTL